MPRTAPKAGRRTPETQPSQFPQRPDPDAKVLTVSQGAWYLSVSCTTVYRLLRDGEIRGLKVRGSLRISRAELDRYLTRLERRKNTA